MLFYLQTPLQHNNVRDDPRSTKLVDKLTPDNSYLKEQLIMRQVPSTLGKSENPKHGIFGRLSLHQKYSFGD